MTSSYKTDQEHIPISTLAANSSDQIKRLDHLLKQAESFAHCAKNGLKITNVEKNGKRKAEPLSDSNEKKFRNNDGQAITSTVKILQFDKTPDYIQGEMRDYQLRGLNWLISLYENDINGILGDEMGLGKTIQTISIFGYLKQHKKINGPFLVVVPLSTIQNWLNEVKRFCPMLRTLLLHGARADRKVMVNQLRTNGRQNWDVCVTTYEMCKVEIHALRRVPWQYFVLDEGHKAKNEKSGISRSLRSIQCKHRLMLTGTPLHNNLHELWALLNFVMPDKFGDSDDFDAWFDTDDCLSGNDLAVQRLHTILGAFMLRRIKSDVETSLLPKQQLKLYIPMTAMQRETYTNVLLKKIKTINELGESSWKVLQMIMMELRKAANHPYLIDGVEAGPPYTTDQHLVDCCGKMQALDQLLALLQSKGSRVVLFSQFVIMLNIIDDYLRWKGYKFLRLDGRTPVEQRANDIDRFNEPNSDVFIYIISTRAGSLGINLATADTVIIYDSDWNPQIDFQAIDRVHRIGQTKQVYVYRLITDNTIDLRMVQRAEIKQRLDEMIVQNSRKLGTSPPPQSAAAPGRSEVIDMIKYDAERLLETKSSDVKFNLNEIIEGSMAKAAADAEKIGKMTLTEASSTSVYQFESVDYRSMGRNGIE